MLKQLAGEGDDEINVEYALADALDIIFHQLNMKDLSSASLVCKLWREAMLREVAKRGPDRLLIPLSKTDSICHLMSSKPRVTLLFVAPITRHICDIKRDVRAIVRKYENCCPGYLAAIGVHYAFMGRTDVTMTSDLSSPSDRMLGLILPDRRDLKIRVGCHPDFHWARDIDKLFDDFFPEDADSGATIILFTQAYEDNSHVTNLIKSRFQRTMAKLALWGGSFYSGLLSIENQRMDEDRCLSDLDSNQLNGVFAVSVSGPNLDSWSTVISCRESKSALVSKLLNLRERLRLRRRSVGLVCGPGDVYDERSTAANALDYHRSPEDFMKAVTEAFPSIPFTGIFDVIPGSVFYGTNSRAHDAGQALEHKMTLSLLIFTYD